SWVAAVEALRRERRAGVLVTLVTVRGHAPREAGAKMVVAADATWDSIGGGNLEATAVARARELLSTGTTRIPELMSLALNDKAPVDHGVQCCGGEVTILLEPLAVVPSVAIFGLGHVGVELARILARHDVELHLVDSRADHVAESALAGVTRDTLARVHVHHAPVPELVLGQVPKGTHVLVMTHDHAEDVALCDVALRCSHLGSIGLIGSSAKWSRFRVKLAEEGHGPDALARITTPIGLADVAGKDPATIAVSVAADLVRTFERDRATTHTEVAR
ncbi:MAG: xanthine dehydrogenase accessory protein XdhC, partial [Lapillicoccus sp.]